MTTDSMSPRADPLAFFPGIAEKLGGYVYLLIDPRDGAIFYVGKGQGNRAFQHARDGAGASPKGEVISAIQEQGLQVQVEVLRHGMTDEVAHAVEAAAMDLLRLQGNALTNVVAGHGARECGWLRPAELRARYGAEPVRIHPDDRVVLIRINRYYRPDMAEEELYNVTRRWWRMDPRKNGPGVALAVYNGVVRRAYRIDPNGWERREKDGRWSLSGAPATELSERYEWRNVSAYVAAGAQNPISYVNCGGESESGPRPESKGSAPGAPARISIDTAEELPRSTRDGSIDPADRVVLIRISRDFRDDMSEQELYDTTRRWWKMDPRKRKPELAFAVVRGSVYRVYRIHDWERRASDGRWGFSGALADDKGARYEGMDVSRLWSRGAQNPIKYVNCWI